jgi:hypothetical protein
MAPGVEVPVVAVVDEALGGDFPAGGLVSAAGVVFDDEALAAQGGGSNGLKVLKLEAACANGLDADAAGNFGGRVVGGAENVAETGEQGPDVWAEQTAGIQVRQQVLHGEQGVDFFGGEPQAGELELRGELVLAVF